MKRNQKAFSPDKCENPEDQFQSISSSTNKIFHQNQLGLHDSVELCLACEKPIFNTNRQNPQYYYNQQTFCLCKETHGRIASPIK